MTGDVCAGCGAAYRAAAQFCSSCGQRRAAAGPSELPLVIWLYLALLAVMVPSLVYVVHLDGDPFRAMVATSAGLLLAIAGFAVARTRVWLPLYGRLGFGARGYGLVVLAAPLVLAVVVAYVALLSRTFDLHQPEELDVVRAHGWAWTLVLVVVFPPLSEELAFRGIIYTGLLRTFGAWESVLISSFAFALLHLSLPTLVTHLPLGIYFCLLRRRSQSLWPSTFAHALHNLGVVIIAQLGLGT